MPGKQGNRNAEKHGVYGYLTIGSLPRGASYIRRALGRFEATLRETVAQDRGEIGVYHAALIQTACRHEARAQLLTRWLRKADAAGEKVGLLDRMAIMREIGAASDARDRSLRGLGLDRPNTTDAIEALYAMPADNADTAATAAAGDSNGKLPVGAGNAAAARLRNDTSEDDNEFT